MLLGSNWDVGSDKWWATKFWDEQQMIDGAWPKWNCSNWVFSIQCFLSFRTTTIPATAIHTALYFGIGAAAWCSGWAPRAAARRTLHYSERLDEASRFSTLEKLAQISRSYLLESTMTAFLLGCVPFVLLSLDNIGLVQYWQNNIMKKYQ